MAILASLPISQGATLTHQSRSLSSGRALRGPVGLGPPSPAVRERSFELNAL
jgi:hypothetical protein